MSHDGPVFLGGVGRSGTTLLAEVLNAHPDMAVSPETKYLTKWQPRISERALADPRRRAAFLDDLLSGPEVRDLSFAPADIAALQSELQGRDELTHREVLTELLTRFAERAGAPRWAEKTPEHLEHFRLLRAWFPDARFVGMVRDPRDVVLSRSKVGWVDTNSVHQARHWRRYARLADDYAADPDLPFLEVRYEDLLREPEATVERLCDFLDLDVDPAMLAHHEAAADDAATFDAAREPWKAKSRRPLDPSNIGKWRDQLDPADVKIVEREAGAEMRGRGYDASGISMTAGLALQVAARYVAHPAQWVRHEARWVWRVKLGRGGDAER